VLELTDRLFDQHARFAEGRAASVRNNTDVHLFGEETAMPTPEELQGASQLYRKAAIEETSLHLKTLLDSHALALELLADKIEHEEPDKSQQTP
jgi:hypothetical protein